MLVYVSFSKASADTPLLTILLLAPACNPLALISIILKLATATLLLGFSVTPIASSLQTVTS